MAMVTARPRLNSVQFVLLVDTVEDPWQNVKPVPRGVLATATAKLTSISAHSALLVDLAEEL